jgi:hypothetical protein
MKLSTCHTDGCPNDGLPFYWDDQAAQQAAQDAGAAFSGTITCGPCGQPITDMADAPSDYPGDPNTFPPPPEPEQPAEPAPG